jgi:trigger factor
MQVSLETGSGLERRLRVDLPAGPIEEEVEKRLQRLTRSARLPGFRPGKVPLKLVRQRYGDSVRAEVLQEQLQASLPEAMAQSDVRPVEIPAIEPIIDAAAGRYGCVAQFEILPEIRLAPLQSSTIRRPVTEVTDEDVAAMLEHLRRQRRTWVPVQRPAADGDQLKVSFTGTVDGESFSGGTGKDVMLELGAGRMIPGFEAGLIGAAAGNERTINVEFPAQYPNPGLAGKAAEFVVQVHEVCEGHLPPLDTEFAESLGIEDGSLERLNADVRANMERETAQRIKGRLKAQVMELLVSSTPIDLPQVLVKQEVQALKEQAGQNSGSDPATLPDAFFDESARRRVALGLIVAEVVRGNNLSASEDKVREAVETLAATYDDPKAVIDFYYADPKWLSSVESIILEDEVVEHVLSQVVVVDEPTTFAMLTGAPA